MKYSKILSTILILCPWQVSLSNEPVLPNIIFILADDLGWQDVGFNGSTWFETPNLDKLASESLVYSHASMYPTCLPSRAALLTGRNSFRTQIYNVPVLEKGNAQNNIFSRWTVESKHPLYAQPLSKAGYKLAHIGKWHIVGPNPNEEEDYPFRQRLSQPANGDMQWVASHKSPELSKYYPRGRGFSQNIGGTWWGDPARGHEDGYESSGGGYIAPYNNPFIQEGTEGEWLTDRLTDEAIIFISENKDRPFFINLNYYAPHRPSIVRSEEWKTKYELKTPDPITGQSASSSTTWLEDIYLTMQQWIATQLLNEESVIGTHNRPAPAEITAYATMVQSLDENIGRLLASLDEQGLRNNTVIFFTSDNGFHKNQSMTNTLRGYKGTIYEGGIRVPALVNWPGVIEPLINDNAITALDYFPTFLDIAGIREEYSEQLDGTSLKATFTGQELEQRTLFWHIASGYMHGPCSMVKKGDWKLIQFLMDGDIELYNIRDDLKESNNLANTNIEKRDELLADLLNWRKLNKVPLPPASSLEY